MKQRLVTYRQCRIKHRLVFRKFSVLALLALAVVSCSRAPEQSSRATGEPSPVATTLSAEQVLQQMSEKLKGARQLTFKVSRQIDAALIEEGDLPEKAQIEFAVSRPDRLKARSTSNDGVRSFYADGKTVALFDEQMKLYASVPSTGTIDEMFARFDENYGFTPPLAEFALNDPYKKMSQQIQTSSNKGLEMINGVECHHVAGTGEFADAEIWVATGDQLPRRLVVTFKQREGSPQLKADFSEWNLAAKLDDVSFSFTPPQGAEKIEMLTTAEMNEAEQQSEKTQEKQK
jgi:hypothetical protein